MARTSLEVAKEMSRRARVHWGDKLVCRLKDGKAVCQLNDKQFMGSGKTNKEALKNVFEVINKNYELRSK